METKGNHEETTPPVLTSSQPHNFDDFRTPTPSSTTFRSGIKISRGKTPKNNRNVLIIFSFFQE